MQSKNEQSFQFLLDDIPQNFDDGLYLNFLYYLCHYSLFSLVGHS